MSWKSHVNSVIDSCKSSLNVIKMIAHQDWGSSTQTLLTIINALIRSKIEYSLSIYNSTTNRMTKKLFSVYHYGLRIATGAHRTTPIMSLYAVSGQIPLEYRISKQLLNYTVRVLGNRNHPNHADFSQPLFQNSYQLAPRISPPCNVWSKILLQELHCKPTLIPQFSLPYPWAIPPPHINIALSQYRKAETNPNWYQILLRDILTNHEKSKLIFTDGSKDATGTGAAFSSEKQKGLFKLPPESSIYSAELYAIKQALKYVLNSEHDTYCILTD
ncbi:uncharacterized protein LOC116163881 [Photinus pyralis]|uniref:uncharacterized protein LOC116163881 n=1 Tax=Photinus pyralis TaxID=7054 RepID=UPI0012672484|nr:uncharacterized protein LOC116163881 [Photinus pyralis]